MKFKDSFFPPKYTRYDQNFNKKIIYFKKIYKSATKIFFIRVIFFLSFIKNVLMKIKNSIFPPKYERYEKNVKTQNCLFKKNLQLPS